MTTTATRKLVVSLRRSDFAKSLRYARKYGGRFCAEHKLWTIPVGNTAEAGWANAPQLYGLMPVDEIPAGCDTCGR